MKFITVKMRNIVFTVAALTVLCVLVVSVSGTNASGVWLGKTPRKMPIHSVDLEEKLVALTFDAFDDEETMSAVLTVLEDGGIPATFFVSGFWAHNNAETLKRMSEADIEIGTKGNTLTQMSRLGASAARLELETGIKAVEEITDRRVELFRPPFGEYSDTLINAADDMGLYIVKWDINAEIQTSQNIASNVLPKVKNGSIIYLSNDRPITAQSLTLIIEGIKNKGYDFVAAGDLIHRENYTINHEGRQVRQA